jgi:hypothetical protein
MTKFWVLMLCFLYFVPYGGALQFDSSRKVLQKVLDFVG